MTHKPVREERMLFVKELAHVRVPPPSDVACLDPCWKSYDAWRKLIAAERKIIVSEDICVNPDVHVIDLGVRRTEKETLR